MRPGTDSWEVWYPRLLALTVAAVGVVLFIHEALSEAPRDDLLVIYAGFIGVPGPVEFARRRIRREGD